MLVASVSERGCKLALYRILAGRTRFAPPPELAHGHVRRAGMQSFASFVFALCVGLAAVAAFVLLQRKQAQATRASPSADASAKLTDEEHARRRLKRLEVLEEMSKRSAEEARAKQDAAAARAAEERLAREALKREQASPAPSVAQRVAPAAPRAALEPPAVPRAVLEAPAVKQQAPGRAVAPPVAATAASPVSIRVQFVQSRGPLQLALPLPLPTVGELKRRVQEAYGDLPPERQRLVFAGQVLAPDDKDLALVKNFGEGACVICQELASAQ